MSEQWTKVHLSHNDAKCKSWLMPQQVKGKEASIKVHADDNAKVTWVGYEEKGCGRTWVPLAEALFHGFHKTVAICQMKDLPEPCLTQTPTLFEFVHLMND